MGTTVEAYVVVRADGTSLDLPPRIQSTLVVGEEVVPPDGDELTDGNGDVIGHIPPRLEVWMDNGGTYLKSFAACWLPLLRGKAGELGFRMLKVSFDWTDDGGIDIDTVHPHGPVGCKHGIRRGDVVEELTVDDVAALASV